MKTQCIIITYLLLTGLLTSACQTPPPLHAVYTIDFTRSASPDYRKTYHPGDAWTLKFPRKRLPDSGESTPTAITITVQFIGPFSAEIADKNMRGKLLMITGPVAQSSHLQTDDWASTDVVMHFLLPKHLTSGSYDFVEEISMRDRSGASSREATGVPIQVVS